jgi:hypothetical protein
MYDDWTVETGLFLEQVFFDDEVNEANWCCDEMEAKMKVTNIITSNKIIINALVWSVAWFRTLLQLLQIIVSYYFQLLKFRIRHVYLERLDD